MVDRAQILEAAIAIGPQQLSMHKVARYLGVSATTLYRYVDSKEALQQACMDEFCSRIVLPDASLSWQAYLAALGRSFNDALTATPGAHAYGTQIGPTTPVAYGILEHALGVLLRAGFPPAMAFNAYALVVDHAFTSAAKRERMAEFEAEFGAGGYQLLRDRAAHLENFPALAATLEAVLPPDFDATYEMRLAMLVSGIAAQLETQGLASSAREGA